MLTASNLSALEIGRRFCVAPMMECTDRHARFLMRRLTRRSLLFTEMVHAGAIVHGDTDRHLAYDHSEHPVALQLGGSAPSLLAEAAQIAEDWGYDEINLNVGCPSDRVQSGQFGACLMAEPGLVADCVQAIKTVCRIPVTVKCRLGIDDQSIEGPLDTFIEKVSNAGCSVFYVHARKAWLKGLNPKENREIPPLHYDRVYRLKTDHPELTIIINGGITTLAHCKDHLSLVDGVMLGRAAYHNPGLLAEVDRLIFNDDTTPELDSVLAEFGSYIDRELTVGVPLPILTRPLLGLFSGQAGARQWRRMLTEGARSWQRSGSELIRAARPNTSEQSEAA